jgi:hypothetical protein
LGADRFGSPGWMDSACASPLRGAACQRRPAPPFGGWSNPCFETSLVLIQPGSGHKKARRFGRASMLGSPGWMDSACASPLRGAACQRRPAPPFGGWSNPCFATSLVLIQPGPGHKKARRFGRASMLGSPGWIRTNDQRINSPLRYRCATGEEGADLTVAGVFRQDLAP